MSDSMDILGTSYKIELRSRESDSALADADGYCDELEKRIVICDCEDEITKSGLDWKRYKRKCLKHEAVHAFLFESGLDYNWEHKEHGHEELMIDWIVTQTPKIASLFSKIDKM